MNLWNTKEIITGTIGSILGAIGFASIVYIWRKFKTRNQIGLDKKIAIEYWRLFGGRSVPLLMKLLSEPHKLIPDSNYDPYYNRVEFSNDECNLIDQKHYSFYTNLKKKRDIRISRVLLWDKYAGNLQLGTWKDFLAKKPTDIETYQLINDNDLDSGASINDYPSSLDWKKHSSNMKDLSGQVGFLFLSIKNISKKSLSNLELTLNKAEVESFLPQQRENRIRGGNSFSLLKKKIKDKGSFEKISADKNIVFAEHIKFNLGTLDPSTEILFLIAVYRSNQKGYDDFFLDDAYKPKSITYQNLKMKLREPLRDASIRELVPDGWFRQ